MSVPDARGPIGTGPADGVRFGLALHLGEVLYGNIGSGNRLDFTCIGPAVNLAARLEKLAVSLGRTIILSAEFAPFIAALMVAAVAPGARAAAMIFASRFMRPSRAAAIASMFSNRS